MHYLAQVILENYQMRFPDDESYTASVEKKLSRYTGMECIKELFNLDAAGQELFAKQIKVNDEDFARFMAVLLRLHNL